MKNPRPRLTPETLRARYLRAFSVSGKTPYGTDIRAAASGSIIDLPISVARALGPAVERVPDDTPLRHQPLMPGMLVETED